MIKIGKIISTFGLKGELKVSTESDFIDQRFKVGNEIILKSHNITIRVKVSSYRIIKNNVCITINELYDINEVEKYLGYDVYSDIELELSDNEYYVDDLIDMEVYNEDSKLLGKVVDMMEIPSSNLLVVDNGEKEFYIPFIDEFIKEVNYDENKIIIHEIEGLY